MVFFDLIPVLGNRPACRTDAPRVVSGSIGENWLGTAATFAPNIEIWASKKTDIEEDLVCMVVLYGVAAKEPAQ